MKPASSRPAWLTWDRVMRVIVMFVALFVITYVFDAAFDSMGINPASTLFNNFTIAYFGAAIILYYEIQASRRLVSTSAKEKSELLDELKVYVRRELTAIGSSAALDDRNERLRRIEEAMSRIEAHLGNPVSAAFASKSPAAPTIGG
jgi:ABC-type multidrug transport system fused ATPase/permease subunit